MKSVGLYKLLVNEKLGEGTLGKTFKAVHQVNNQTVVMKVIQKNKSCESKHTKQLLKAEIKYFMKIRNQNIASYIDIIETVHNFYVLRQYCPDGSLRDRINFKGRLSQNEVLQILVQILKAMFQLIQKGLIHKNLIPQNILFSNSVLKLADFGIHKIKHQILQEPEMNSKFQYKSPQLLNGARGNFKCDVWALGIILYESIYGAHPWPSSSQGQLRENIAKQKIKFPSDVQISLGLRKFILSCLMQDMNERAEWRQIFQSNLLQQFQLPKLHNLNETYAQILSLLRRSILQSNLDVERYFKSQKLTSQDTLKYPTHQISKKAFSVLIQPMVPLITDEQVEFLFVTIDRNGDNMLQVSEFQDAMKEFDIPLQGSYRRIAEKLLKDYKIDKDLKQEERKEKQLTRIYQGLVENLQKKQIYDLYDVFTESDKKRVGELQFNEFVTLLRRIDKTLTKTECQKIFNAFDQNCDQKISFNEFFGHMCKITGSPNGLSH